MNAEKTETKPLERKTYRVPVENWEGLTERIEKLNKRAVKLGCEPAIIEIVRKEDEVCQSGEVIRYHVVTVEGKAPVLNGWRFLARLQHVYLEGKTESIIRTIPGYTIPEKYQTAENYCDHCQLKRYRTDTFIVQNEQTDEYKQVGRQCLKDFLGHTSPGAIAALAEHLSNLDAMVEEAMGRNANGKPHMVSLKIYLSYVSAAIRTKGWVSRTKAGVRPELEATANYAFKEMFPESSMERDDKLTLIKEDEELANSAIEWVRGNKSKLDRPNDYEHNLCVVSGLEAIKIDMIGLAASIIPYYERATREKVDQSGSEWVGTIGEKVKLSVVVNRIIPYENKKYGGTMQIHKMSEINSNNALVWFSSGKKLEEGKELKIQGIVKGHNEFRGVKETVLTRVRSQNELQDEIAEGLEPGVYEVDNEIFVVKPNREGTQLYAKKLVEASSDRLTEKDQRVKFDFVYDKGAIYRIKPEHRMDIKRAKVLIIRYGRCIVCGRRLKVAESVERGIGPVCIKAFRGYGE